MKLALLGPTTGWHLDDLRRAAGSTHQLVPLTYPELASQVDATTIGLQSGTHDLRQFDALLVRSMPPGSLEQVVFRMNALALLASAGVRVVNPPRAIETAVDKFLTTARLQAAGLLVPRTLACQTWQQAMEGFAALGEDVVVKPLFGGEGRGITRIDDEAVAARVFRTLQSLGSVLYLQEFIPHAGADLRVLVLGEKLVGMRRCHPDDWRTNISRGARAEPLEVTPELAEMARRAAAAVGTTIAGVDLLPGLDGQLYAIEVNAVPGWRALAQVSELDLAQEILATLEM
jgi:ribosomal protein S6--L-glutamate ligase